MKKINVFEVIFLCLTSVIALIFVLEKILKDFSVSDLLEYLIGICWFMLGINIIIKIVQKRRKRKKEQNKKDISDDKE